MAATFAGPAVWEQAFIDRSGNFKPGEPVTVYVRGTTTKATLYTDHTKATTRPNPTATDAEGNLWLFADPGRYQAEVDGKTLYCTVVADPAEPVDLELADGSVTAAKLADGAATGDALGADVVTEPELASLATAVANNGLQIGAHVADVGDAHDASAVSFAPPAGMAATDVQAAIAELWAAIQAEGATRAAADTAQTAARLALRDELLAHIAEPPDPLTNLVATNQGEDAIELTWTASPDGGTATILRGTVDGGPYTEVVDEVVGTTYLDTGLAPNTTYFYVARAAHPGGVSANSNQASATTDALPPPDPPTDLTAVAVGLTGIDLSWVASPDGGTYTILRGTAPGGPYGTTVATGVVGTTYSDTGLAPNTTYYYVARAVTIAGTSANSNQASATTPPAPQLPVVVQSKAAAIDSGDLTVPVTFDAAPTQGNLLLAFVGSNHIASITGWTLDLAYAPVSFGKVFSKIAGAGEPALVTVELQGAAPTSVVVVEVDHTLAAGYLDRTATAGGPGVVSDLAVGPTAALSQAVEVAFAVVNFLKDGFNRSVTAWSNGFTELAEAPASTSGMVLAVAVKVVQATTALSTTATFDPAFAASGAQGAIVTYRGE